MAAAAVLSGLQIATTLEPLVIPLVSDLTALFKKHPTLTPDQLTALVASLVSEIHATNADTLATIAADQAKT